MLRIALPLSLLLAACRAEPPSGIFRCESDADCPESWGCRADEIGERFCFRAAREAKSSSSAEADASVGMPVAGCSSPDACAMPAEQGGAGSGVAGRDTADSSANGGIGGGSSGASAGSSGSAGASQPKGAGSGPAAGAGGVAGASQPRAAGAAPTAGGGAGGATSVRCSEGSRACPNGQCRPIADDPLFCGSSCEPCPSGAICSSGTCAPCASAYEHTCTSANRCFANTDPTHCGPACMACERRPYAKASCESNACKWRCDANTLVCSDGTTCAPAAWDFEDNATQGWTSDESTAQFPNAAGALSVTTARVHGGKYALAAPLQIVRGTADGGVFRTTLCTLETPPDLRGKTISAWFYFDGPAVSGEGCCQIFPYVFVKAKSGTTSFSPNGKAMLPEAKIVPLQWFKVSGTMPGDLEQPVYTFTFQWSMDVATWSGTVYIDDVRVE